MLTNNTAFQLRFVLCILTKFLKLCFQGTSQRSIIISYFHAGRDLSSPSLPVADAETISTIPDYFHRSYPVPPALNRRSHHSRRLETICRCSKRRAHRRRCIRQCEMKDGAELFPVARDLRPAASRPCPPIQAASKSNSY